MVTLLVLVALLPTDVLVLPKERSKPPYENTAVVATLGRKRYLVVSCGSPPQYVRTEILADGFGKAEVVPVPDLSGVYHGTDNQLIRLKDGTLLAMRAAATNRTFPPDRTPAWSKELISFHITKQKALRGALSFIESRDAGQTWKERSLLDFGLFENGRFGIPRPMSTDGRADVPFDQQGKNDDGSPKWWLGGSDRDEVYACPFTGNLYATSRIITGPYEKGKNNEDVMLVMGSKDVGKSWSLLTTISAWSPAVMTTTRDGRLWIFQEIGDTCQLTLSNPAGRGFPNRFETTQVDTAGLTIAGPKAVAMEIKIGHPSIARIGPSILVSYQVRNDAGNQGFGFTRVSVGRSGKLSQERLNQIWAQSPETHSMMYGALVESPSLRSRRCLFYWLEAPQKDGAYGARYALLDDGRLIEKGSLAQTEGRDRTWTERRNPGDYMKGTAYSDRDGSTVYIPQWVEPDGLHATLIRNR